MPLYTSHLLELYKLRKHIASALRFFAGLCAYIKLERLKITEKLNQFALKGKLYLKAIQAAFRELQALKSNLTKNENQLLCA